MTLVDQSFYRIIAILAAIALHGLLLWIPMPTITRVEQSQQQPLQIHLFTPPISTPTPPKPMQQLAPSLPTQKKQPQRAIKTPPIHKPLPVIIAQQKKAIAIPIKHLPVLLDSSKIQLTKPITLPQALSQRGSSSAIIKKKTQIISNAMRMKISAQVHYPKRARRHGWQGTVECEFDVRNHRLQKITILTPSDHAILNRAAKRGLQALGAIDLIDGRYHIPVVFHLAAD